MGAEGSVLRFWPLAFTHICTYVSTYTHTGGQGKNIEEDTQCWPPASTYMCTYVRTYTEREVGNARNNKGTDSVMFSQGKEC